MTQNPIAVSTWSVHHLLEKLSLEKLPAVLAKRGYGRVEICHFHLSNQQPEYLRGIGKLFRDHGVIIQTLLIDDGDLTNPATRARDLAWIASWVEAAAVLGAENARVIAGKAKPSAEALALSIDGLKAIGKLGRERGVRIVTENWFDLLSSPTEVHHVLDALGSDVGLLADMGNWSGPTKYEGLKSIFARAELCHAKCAFGDALDMNCADYGSCMKAAREAGYSGPYTLIFDSPGDEWAGLAMEEKFVRDYYAV
jgi:sugar phosphate isomerase/epimerase